MSLKKMVELTCRNKTNFKLKVYKDHWYQIVGTSKSGECHEIVSGCYGRIPTDYELMYSLQDFVSRKKEGDD